MFHCHSHRFGRRHARDERGPSEAPGEQQQEHRGRRRFGRGDRPAGLGRFFAHGDLRLVILQLIAEQPRYGYEIIKAIEERVGGAYSPSPGTVYPTLTLLEELGHVTVKPGEGTKKLHEITAEGRAFLEGSRRAVDMLLARMADAARAAGGGPPAAVVRGMENLKLAVRLRLGNGPLTGEQAAAVAAALDAAATAIERT